MTVMVSAGYDALMIANRFQQMGERVAIAELHLFAYLSCLLTHYGREDPEFDWSYDFVATPSGAPYAPALDEESQRLRAAGRLIGNGTALGLSAEGARELETLSALSVCEGRTKYLETACTASTLMPLPTINYAVSREPQLRRALQQSATRKLLVSAGIQLLREHFLAVERAIRERSSSSSDLLVPTAVWLEYLVREDRT